MTLNLYILQEIMKIDIEDSQALSNLNSFALLQKHVTVNVVNDENYDISYQASVDDILKSSIDPMELITLRHSGWELSEDNKFLYKFLTK